MQKPQITKEQIIFWFHRFRKLDTKKLEHRRRLIDNFANSIYLFEDRLEFNMNYKDGAQVITFGEVMDSPLGSDLTALAAPKAKTPQSYAL